MVSSKSKEAAVLTLFISIITIISPLLKKTETADSILYLTLDVFFEILNRCSQNSSRGGHYSCRWRSGALDNILPGLQDTLSRLTFSTISHAFILSLYFFICFKVSYTFLFFNSSYNNTMMKMKTMMMMMKMKMKMMMKMKTMMMMMKMKMMIMMMIMMTTMMMKVMM